MAESLSLIISKKEFRVLSLAIMLAICGSFGMDIHLASLPYIMKALGTSRYAVQQSISLYMLGAAFSILVYGPLSDKLGRKPVIIMGLTIFCISSLLTIWIKSVTLFLLLRLIQGSGAGVCWGLSRIVAADVMQNERLAAIGSYVTLFISLSPLFAPLLGGYIQHWVNWQANFFILALMIFSILLFFIFCFEETNKQLDADAFKLKPMLSNYQSLFKHRVFIGALLLGGVSLAINIIYITLSSFIFQDQFNVSPITFGWLTAIIAGANFATKLIAPWFILKSNVKKIMGFGIGFIWLAGLTLFIPELLGIMNIKIVLIGASIAMVPLNLIGNTSMSLALSPFHTNRGSAGALYGAFQLLFSFAISAFAATMTLSGTLVMSELYLILGVLGVVIFWYYLR